MTEMTFGETVKAERVKRGWSQQVLANRAGMNRSHIGGIELKPGPHAEPIPAGLPRHITALRP